MDVDGLEAVSQRCQLPPFLTLNRPQLDAKTWLAWKRYQTLPHLSPKWVRLLFPGALKTIGKAGAKYLPGGGHKLDRV